MMIGRCYAIKVVKMFPCSRGIFVFTRLYIMLCCIESVFVPLV